MTDLAAYTRTRYLHIVHDSRNSVHSTATCHYTAQHEFLISIWGYPIMLFLISKTYVPGRRQIQLVGFRVDLNVGFSSISMTTETVTIIIVFAVIIIVLLQMYS